LIAICTYLRGRAKEEEEESNTVNTKKERKIRKAEEIKMKNTKVNSS
jgi:hypothetical protein